MPDCPCQCLYRMGPGKTPRRRYSDVKSSPQQAICDVAILTYDLRASGVVRNALRIGEALSASGLSVQFWVIRRKGQLLTQFGQNFEVKPLRNDAFALPRDVDSLISIPAITRAVDLVQPAVLLSAGNQMHIHAANALRFAKHRDKTRFVGRASNAVIDTGGRRTPLRFAAGLFEKRQFRAMDRIIAVSCELQSDLIDRTDVNANKITFVPNGVDVEAAQDQSKERLTSCGAFDGHNFILGVGRLTRQKDFATLIRAFQVVRSQRPDLRLVIVGHGSRAVQRSLRRLTERANVADATTFVGYHKNPLTFMAKASVFVSSSRWEGASNVILEALACGTPVVATAAPTGIREVLAPGDIAPLAPVGDHLALAHAILARLSQPRNAASLIGRAEQYSLRSSLQGYVDCLTSEVSRARHGASPFIQSSQGVERRLQAQTKRNKRRENE